MVVEKQIVKCTEILQKKEKEYVTENTDRLVAFKVAAILQRCSPKEALAGMMAKHIVSIYDMCNTHSISYDMATWEEKITDSMNYLILLRAIVEEEQGHG